MNIKLYINSILILIFLTVSISYIFAKVEKEVETKKIYCDTLYIKMYNKNPSLKANNFRIFMWDAYTNNDCFSDSNQNFALPKCNFKDTLLLSIRHDKIEDIYTEIINLKNIDTIYIGYKIVKRKWIR